MLTWGSIWNQFQVTIESRSFFFSDIWNWFDVSIDQWYDSNKTSSFWSNPAIEDRVNVHPAENCFIFTYIKRKLMCHINDSFN